MKGSFHSKVGLGKIGEHLLAAELYKHNISSVMIGWAGIKEGADILIKNKIFIEVKTSVFNRNAKKTSTKKGYCSGWSFGFVNRSQADFLVLCLLNEDKSLHKFITFPKGHLSGKQYFYLKPFETVIPPRGPARSETKICEDFEYINLILEACATN